MDSAPPPSPVRPTRDTLAVLRLLLLATFVVGAVGVGAELLLLEHFEDVWQFVPLVLVALALAVLGWSAATRGAASLRAFQGTMALFLVSGVVGVLLHYRGNVAFELEMAPALRGLALFKEAMMGATPALAPGAMIQLGLVGLAYTFRHPRLMR
jgi:hypothetical protein